MSGQVLAHLTRSHLNEGMDVAKTVEIPAALLVAAGETLHGAEWRLPLARSLGMASERTIQRWSDAARAGGMIRVSRSLLIELAELLEAHVADVAGALRKAAAS